MALRILTGGLHHESDTFNPLVTGWQDIVILRGDELLSADSSDAAGGIIRTLKKAGCDVIPSLLARAIPGGPWTDECFCLLRDEILETVKASLPLDGICLALHGSMRSVSIDDAEGDLLEHIRRICPEVPIYVSLDMHCSMTEKMFSCIDAAAAYKCAPHTDEEETGALAASMLLDHLMNGVRHYKAWFSLPMLMAGEKSETGTEPMKTLTAMLREKENAGLAAASILMGFPWADSASSTVSTLAVSAASQEEADRQAASIAQAVWNARWDFAFCTTALNESDAIEWTKEKLAKGTVPVVLSDSGDNPTAGSSQDVVYFLKELMDDPVLSTLSPPLCYQAVFDSKVVRQAFEAGPGACIDISLGAKYDRVTGGSLRLKARVRALKRGFRSGLFETDLALLHAGGVDVIVTGSHTGCYDPEMMRSVGLQPEKLSVIVVKLGYLEPEIRAAAASICLVLTRGSTDEVLERLDYRKVKRPVFPLDREAEVLFP